MWRSSARPAALPVALLVTLALAGSTLAGCARTRSTPAAPGAIRLGALFPMSGPETSAGKRSADAAKLAVKEANDGGGVLGRQVELIIGDDACDAHTAVVAANSLTTQEITVSVGGACSVATVPTVKIFRDAGIPMIIPTSNSTDLVSPRYDSVFLLSGTTEAEAAFAVREIRRVGGHRISVIDDGTSHSANLADVTLAAAVRPDSGISASWRQTLSEGAANYRRIADEALRLGADAVYFTGYNAEAARLIIDLKGAGFTGRIVLGDGAFDDVLLTKLTPEQSEGIYGTAFPTPQFVPGAAEWAARYEATYGTAPGTTSMEAADAVKLALDAIRRAGSTGRAAVRTAIAATNGLRLLTGPITFNPDGTRADPQFLLLQVRAGAFALSP